MSPLKTKRIKALYKCKQEELYQVLLHGWDSFLQNQPLFETISTIYTILFGNTQRQAVLDAKAMPDFQERDETSESLLVLLKDAADPCLIQWKHLEGHIIKAYPKNLHKSKLESAGFAHYAKAAHNDWESVSALMKSGTNFITNNTATLISGGMPPTFPSTFTSLRSTFDTLLSQFKNAEQTKEQQRDAKIQANNEIFQITSDMFLDGQKIFRNDAATRERFTFSKILELVSGTTPQPKKTITLATNQAVPDKVNMLLLGGDGQEVTADYGNNTSETKTTNSINYIMFSVLYSIAGNYVIKLMGNAAAFLELFAPDAKLTAINLPEGINLRALDLLNNLLTSFFLPLSCIDMLNLQLNNNALAQQSINQTLIQLAANGKSNGMVNLAGGTNQAPSGQGIAAKNQLIARGWNVITN